jgi:hypothetical protein
MRAFRFDDAPEFDHMSQGRAQDVLICPGRRMRQHLLRRRSVHPGPRDPASGAQNRSVAPITGPLMRMSNRVPSSR